MADKIVLSGYYGFNNLGDEAVLYSILRTLRTAKPDIKFTVLSNDPAKTKKAYNVDAVNRWSIKEVIRALYQCDLLISGGGSLLQDTTSPKSLLYYLGVVFLAKLLRKKVIYYAQGIGPINTYLGQKLMPLVSNMVDVIAVRDQDSKDLLQKLNVQKPPIYVKADAVLGLYRKEIERKSGQDLLTRNGIDLMNKKSMIGIAVREWQGFSGYLKVVARLADELIRKDYSVLLLPMHFPGDVTASREVVRLMEEEPVLIKEPCSVIEMLGIVGELDLMIGMRLHSLIIAAVMGVPSVGISYDPKVDSFMKLTEQPVAGRVETLDYDVLAADVFKVLDNLEEVKSFLEERVSELRVEARDNACLALSLLPS
ncbi:MAG: polysaccharide pyruvyl transferase CsaB [Zhaonellaceae bacterium]|jgi:polysaccharide pyruvyl transferase CsaB